MWLNQQHSQAQDDVLLENQQLLTATLKNNLNNTCSGTLIREQQNWKNHQNSDLQVNKIQSPIYNCRSVSPLEDGSEQAMSLSSSEDLSKNGNTEDESFSDLEYSDSSPLLDGELSESSPLLERENANFNTNDRLINGDRCNNNKLASRESIPYENPFDSMSQECSDSEKVCLLNNSFNSTNNANYNDNKGVIETSIVILTQTTQNIATRDNSFVQENQRNGTFVTCKNDNLCINDFNVSLTSEENYFCDISPMSVTSSEDNMDMKYIGDCSNVTSKHNNNEESSEQENVGVLIEIQEDEASIGHDTNILKIKDNLQKNNTKNDQLRPENVDISEPKDDYKKLDLNILNQYDTNRSGMDVTSPNNNTFCLQNYKGKVEISEHSEVFINDTKRTSVSFDTENVQGIQFKSKGLQITANAASCDYVAPEKLETFIKIPDESPEDKPLALKDKSFDVKKEATKTNDEHENSDSRNKQSSSISTSIKPFQIHHPSGLAVLSSLLQNESLGSKQNNRQLNRWSIKEDNSVFTENTLNNNSITNSIVYKNMVEKVTKVPPSQNTKPSNNIQIPSLKNSMNHVISNNQAKPKKPQEFLGNFDVYNIETAMPTIDWAAMEAHLTEAAKETNWYLRRRQDREEIRRKLAMDSDNEDYYCGEKVTKKPSLTTRLQSGMNLQICFMNETASDQEGQASDHDTENMNFKNKNKHMRMGSKNKNLLLSNGEDNPLRKKNKSEAYLKLCLNETRLLDTKRPSFLFTRPRSWRLCFIQKKDEDKRKKEDLEEDFLTRHARLQAEARMALAQAKEMARMQMEVERQRKKKSPIAEIVGFPLPDGRHRLSRQILTDMNIGQLQVIVNDIHTQIESLNEELVQLLLERDDLHMEQDSMLVDIEDLTRYLGAKDEALRTQQTTVQLCRLKIASK
ncbi:uncharacterized protein LOC143238084 isoform X2 [Tachypleus tridentatus]